MRHTKPLLLLGLFTLLTLLLFSSTAQARPKYAKSTSKDCITCHTSQSGGTLNSIGLNFAASGYEWPPAENGYRELTPIKKSVRLFIGFIHIVAVFMWFGTILYVHIMLRPGYASKGLPRGEIVLGLSSMLVVGVTGILLTISRINGISVLYDTRWGLLLLCKIAIYLVMVGSALTVVTFVGPRLRQVRSRLRSPKDGLFDPLTLAGFDGKEGRPAYVAYKGRVYDVTESRLWSAGTHMRLHAAGGDLSDAIFRAPHNADKIEEMEAVGTYDSSSRPAKNGVQKAFYFIAYMNLTLVFCVLLVIALWRWS